MMWGWNDGSAGAWAMMLTGLLFWAVMVGAIIYAVTRLSRSDAGSRGHDAGRPSSARAILEERLARGEIDEEEFRRKKELLGGG